MHDNGYPFRKFRRASPSVSDGVFLDCPRAMVTPSPLASSPILSSAVQSLEPHELFLRDHHDDRTPVLGQWHGTARSKVAQPEDRVWLLQRQSPKTSR